MFGTVGRPPCPPILIVTVADPTIALYQNFIWLDRDVAERPLHPIFLGNLMGMNNLIKDFSPKHINLGVVFDFSLLAFNYHDIHGVTPWLSNHFRMLETAPLSVSGVGWALWNTLTSLNKNTPTLEPSRSLTSAPRATNIASISFHLILPLIGLLKISSRVLRCLRFIRCIVPNYGTLSRIFWPLLIRYINQFLLHKPDFHFRIVHFASQFFINRSTPIGKKWDSHHYNLYCKLMKSVATNETNSLSIKLVQRCHLKPEHRLPLEVCYERWQKFTAFRLSRSEIS